MALRSSDTSGADFGVPKSHGLSTGAYCSSCPLAHPCGDRDTSAACGHPSEYRDESLHPLKIKADDSWKAAFEVPAPNDPLKLVPLPCGLVVAKAREMWGVETFGVALEKVFGRTEASQKGRQIGVLHGRDEHLDRLWRERGRLAEKLIDRGYSAVVSPGFSNYWEWSPPDNLVMVARAMEMIEILAEKVPTIPTIVARNKKDIERWVEWLSVWTPPYISIHFSDGHRPQVWKWLVREVAGISAVLSAGHWIPTLLANGISTVRRMATIVATWPGDVVFASQKPWQLARHGREMDANLRGVKAAASITTEQLTAANARQFITTVESIAQARVDGTGATAMR